jgi:tetratricopeptide (TPR) repeat protein
VKRIVLLSAVSSLAALSLAACTTAGPAPATTVAADRAPLPSLAGMYLAANFAAATGDVKGAANFYSDTLADDPDNPDILARAFLFHAESGDIDKASSLAGRVIALQPDDRIAHLVLETVAIQNKNYAVAVKDLDTAPSDAFWALSDALVRAWALAGEKNYDGALKALDSLPNQRGVDGLKLMHRALILDYAGRAKDADAAYLAALKVMGTGPRAADAFGRFLVRQGRIEEAKALYAAAAKENPDNPVVAQALGDIAAKRMMAALVASPAEGVAEGLFGIAASLNDNRSTDVAILYYNLALYLRPDFDLAKVLLATRYENLEKYDVANQLYMGIPPGSPYYVMTQVQSAVDDGKLNHPEAGIAKMETLAKANPDSLDVWTALGDLDRSADHYAQAVGAYDKAIAALPNGDSRLVGLLFARGISYERTNRWALAEKDLREALKLNPNRADVLNYLGYSFVDKGENLEEALTMLEKAHALRPLDGYIADSVGWAYYRVGRYQDAARTLEEAVQLAPAAADVNDHLGDAYWRVGRKIDARFQWAHALSLDPDPKLKPVLERKLQFGLDAVSASGS